MKAELAKITSKGQITIPQKIRERLQAQTGDGIVFKLMNDRIVIEKVDAAEYQWYKNLEAGLSEWEDDLDDEL